MTLINKTHHFILQHHDGVNTCSDIPLTAYKVHQLFNKHYYVQNN